MACRHQKSGGVALHLTEFAQGLPGRRIRHRLGKQHRTRCRAMVLAQYSSAREEAGGHHTAPNSGFLFRLGIGGQCPKADIPKVRYGGEADLDAHLRNRLGSA